MEAYFANSATTKALDSVRDIMVKTLTEDFGNPSAKHTKGMEAENYIRQAAADIAKTLKVKDKEILFTSGLLLNKIRNRHQNWLELILRIIYNSGGFLTPIRW